MGKAKKGKKPSSDSVYAKKTNAAAKANPFGATTTITKKINPFEVHVNKEKFQILGRTCKHDKGLPGVSRGKAVKKRQETLGQEFRDKHKTNNFRDRRIGKHLSSAQLDEDVLNARFVADKLSQLKQTRESRFNLNDNEVLTHRGQTLEEIEQFHDDRSDDEDPADDTLDAKFTEAAHFGGDGADGTDRKTAIDEMIVEQKRRKMEIAKEKDQINELTDKLDSSFKNLAGLMNKMSKRELKARPAPDDYDQSMREMVFEPRGIVADKLVSEEDAARNEQQRLQELEKERLKRMQGDGDENDENERPKHRSADDLDDGYFAYGDVEEEDGTLAYNADGSLSTKIGQENGNASPYSAHQESEAEEDESEDNDSEGEEGEEEVEEEESEGAEDDSDAEEDDLSDLKVSDSEDDDDDEDIETKSTTKREKPNNISVRIGEKNSEHSELPFTIEMPTSYQDFSKLLAKRTPDEKATIVERLIKCNHPKLDGVNREKVVKLFAFLLQHVEDLFDDVSPDDIVTSFRVLDRLNPQLYDLMHLNPERMSLLLLDVVKEKHAQYCKNPKVFPSLDTIIYFKLVGNYFSTSDFRHPVVTPCYIFMQHILSRARVRTRQDVALGLFLVTIALEYAEQSRRFLPAVFNFLLGVIYISIPKRPADVTRILPPFQSTGPMNKLLAIGERVAEDTCTMKMLQSADLVMTTLSADFKVRALNTTLKLIKDAITGVKEVVGANYLAEPLLDMIDRLDLTVYPKYVCHNRDAAVAALQAVASKSLIRIVPPEKKPKALRLLEPRFEAVYDDKRRPKLSKEKEEKVKLVHKLKRETKGAVREIRRDTEFLQKMRIQQQIQSDMERKEKVKRIYQEASVQQGELNELMRAKKKKF